MVIGSPIVARFAGIGEGTPVAALDARAPRPSHVYLPLVWSFVRGSW